MPEGELQMIKVPDLIQDYAQTYYEWGIRNGCFRVFSHRQKFDPMTNDEVGKELDRLKTEIIEQYGDGLAVLRPHLGLGLGVTGDGEPYRPVAEMTLWELAQAIAINSDVATNLWVKTAETEEEEDANRAKAMRYFDRRNDCVGEIRDREQRTPPANDRAIAGRGEVDPKVQAFADWLDEHPNGIEDLRSLVSSARYSVERTAHPPEDHKRVDVFSDLVKRLRDAP